MTTVTTPRPSNTQAGARYSMALAAQPQPHAARPAPAPALPKRVALALVLAAMGLLGACATPRNGYVGATEAQQRMEAEADRPTASIDTQATYLKLVEQMQQNSLWFASLAHIDRLEQRWGVSPESNRLRADALRQTGQPAESAAFYQRLMRTPLEAAAYHGLGLLAGERTDFSAAVRLLEQARQQKPADPVLLGDLGYAQMYAGNLDAARLPLMQAFELKPDNPLIQVNLALYLQATRHQDRAEALMDAQKMPPATRAAIRDAARRLAGPALPALPQGAADSPLPLRASAWSGFSGGAAVKAGLPAVQLPAAELSASVSAGLSTAAMVPSNRVANESQP